MDFSKDFLANPAPHYITFTYDSVNGVGYIEITALWWLVYLFLICVFTYKVMRFFALPALKKSE